MNFYLITVNVFLDLNNNFKFKPALLTASSWWCPLANRFCPPVSCLMTNLVLGAAYRFDAAISGMVGFSVEVISS